METGGPLLLLFCDWPCASPDSCSSSMTISIMPELPPYTTGLEPGSGAGGGGGGDARCWSSLSMGGAGGGGGGGGIMAES